jgi:transposase-like protein
MQDIDFQCWLAKTEGLSGHQREIAVEIIQEEDVGNVLSIIENVRPNRQCPHCHTDNSVKRGFANNLQRYQCKACRRTFNALTGTPLSRLRFKEQWLGYASELIEGLSLRKIAKICPISKNTAFLWRHRFLQIPSLNQAPQFEGITEADETYFLESFKGQRILNRPSRKRGGKASKRGLSDEQVPVLVARDRSGATANAVFDSPSNKNYIQQALSQRIGDSILCTDSSKAFKAFAKEAKICHKMVNTKAGIRVIEKVFHIQNVNSYCSNLKRWITRFKGVATRHLDKYLGWFRLLDRVGEQLNPHRCLVEALAGISDMHT